MAPFRPAAATVAQATSGTSTAAVVIPALSPVSPTFQVRVVNAGTDAVFFKFGPAGVGPASATADVPVRGGETEIFTLTGDQTHFRVIAAAHTPTVYLTAGYGG
jgi:hypothetical protein